MNVGDLIFDAGVMAGIFDPADDSDGVPAEWSNYSFRKLNLLMDTLAADRLAIYKEQRVGPFNVTAGMGNITTNNPISIGPGGDWDTARPLFIDRAGVIYTQGGVPQPELSMRIFTTKEWAGLQTKGTTSTLSRGLFYDRDIITPGTPSSYKAVAGRSAIYLYPIPSAPFKVVLYVPVALTQFGLTAESAPDLTAALVSPPGYAAMLVSNLAVKLCLGLKAVDPDVKQEAIDTLAVVKSSNLFTFMDPLSCDPATRIDGDSSPGGFDWLTGGIT